MSASLILTSFRHPKGAVIDWKAVDNLVDNFEDFDLLIEQLENAEGELPPEDDEVRPEVKKIFAQLSELIENSYDYNAVVKWEIGDQVMYITGGMSYGDHPTEECVVFSKAACFPQIYTAIGLT